MCDKNFISKSEHCIITLSLLTRRCNYFVQKTKTIPLPQPLKHSTTAIHNCSLFHKNYTKTTEQSCALKNIPAIKAVEFDIKLKNIFHVDGQMFPSSVSETRVYGSKIQSQIIVNNI